jgi:serum/glucocorticoid-regulated kinase 2
MSWRLGKKKAANLGTGDDASIRSLTPTPGDERGVSRTGILSIRVINAQDLDVPAGTALPAAVQSALASQQAQVAASMSPSSVTQDRLAKASRSKRDSVQRTQCWWLPYLVMEFEVNQILITPLGGELAKPLYMYQAHFDVSRNSEISISAYLRKEEPKRNEGANDMGNDMFMGGITFIPDFDNMGSQDQWYDLQGGSGKILVGVSFQPSLVRCLVIPFT